MKSHLPATLGCLGALILVACGSPQKPVTFTTSANAEAGLDEVSRILAAEGHQTTNVDRRAGIVYSEYKDSGFLYGQIQNQPATMVRRFIVVLSPAGGGSNVTVRMDAKRCARGAFTISRGEVSGTCEEMDAIPDSFQAEIDSLGAKVKNGLGGGAPPAASAPPAAR
jgi:hypothetical protein